MDITVTQAQGRVPVTVLRLKGDLDSSTYQKFEASADQAINGGARDLIVDMTDIGYMSSAGLRAIIKIFNSLHSDAEQEALRKGMMANMAKSPHLKLAGLNKNVANVFGMAGFDMYLDIHKDSKTALAAF